MTCVCGHTYDAHTPTGMSVPLRGATPTRYVPPTASSWVLTVARSHPTASYERLACPCGCCEWLPDTDC